MSELNQLVKEYRKFETKLGTDPFYLIMDFCQDNSWRLNKVKNTFENDNLTKMLEFKIKYPPKWDDRYQIFPGHYIELILPVPKKIDTICCYVIYYIGSLDNIPNLKSAHYTFRWYREGYEKYYVYETIWTCNDDEYQLIPFNFTVFFYTHI